MPTAPTLPARRLTLRPLTKATQDQVAWLRDPIVTRFSEQRHAAHTLSTQLRYVNTFPGFLWGIHLVSTNEHIGNISAALDLPNKIADIGILIGELTATLHGFGTEAWLTATNWLLSSDGAGIRKLEAGCMANNIGMRKILEKTSFKYEGERLNHFLFEGSPIGLVFYGRFK